MPKGRCVQRVQMACMGMVHDAWAVIVAGITERGHFGVRKWSQGYKTADYASHGSRKPEAAHPLTRFFFAPWKRLLARSCNAQICVFYMASNIRNPDDCMHKRRNTSDHPRHARWKFQPKVSTASRLNSPQPSFSHTQIPGFWSICTGEAIGAPGNAPAAPGACARWLLSQPCPSVCGGADIPTQTGVSLFQVHSPGLRLGGKQRLIFPLHCQVVLHHPSRIRPTHNHWLPCMPCIASKCAPPPRIFRTKQGNCSLWVC